MLCPIQEKKIIDHVDGNNKFPKTCWQSPKKINNGPGRSVLISHTLI